jgi:hypothetical protein
MTWALPNHGKAVHEIARRAHGTRFSAVWNHGIAPRKNKKIRFRSKADLF